MDRYGAQEAGGRATSSFSLQWEMGNGGTLGGGKIGAKSVGQVVLFLRTNMKARKQAEAFDLASTIGANLHSLGTSS